MFTGLVAAMGTLAALDSGRLSVTSGLASELAEGDSVSVDGVCLTATRVGADGFDADVMPETLRRTTLGRLTPGDSVNLEPALRASERMGGHLVQGHVDDTGVLESVTEEGFSRRLRIDAPPAVLRYVVEKGSIAVDGVSLTVAEVDDEAFTVALIPETLERTTLGAALPGRRLNLEVDLVAKYVEKLVAHTVEAS